jgi:hypothetical protein
MRIKALQLTRATAPFNRSMVEFGSELGAPAHPVSGPAAERPYVIRRDPRANVAQKVVSFACSLVVTLLLACAGNVPIPTAEDVSVRLGETIIVSLIRNEDGKARATLVPEAPESLPFSRLEFSDKGSYRMLKIQNGTSYVMRVNVMMCISQSGQCADTNVLPLAPDQTNYETWGDPIDLLVFSDFQLEKP